MKNSDHPAFACAAEGGHQAGLTKRELFAAMAMQGYCSNNVMPSSANMDSVSRRAVLAADALLNALEASSDFAAFVTFNGERLRWTDQRITYAQAVRTCNASADLGQVWTVSFSTRAGRSGTLRAGQDTYVEDGMVIDAAVTGRA